MGNKILLSKLFINKKSKNNKKEKKYLKFLF